jgi:hypothetical protein
MMALVIYMERKGKEHGMYIQFCEESHMPCLLPVPTPFYRF